MRISIKGLGVLGALLIVCIPMYARMQVHAASVLRGHVLIDVEHRGEAWYVDSETGHRILLANAMITGDVIARYGLGISNADLDKIPLGFLPVTQHVEQELGELEDAFATCDADMASALHQRAMVRAWESTFIEKMDGTSVSSAFFRNAFIDDVENDLEMLKQDHVMEEMTWTPEMLLCMTDLVRKAVVQDEHMRIIRNLIQGFNPSYEDMDMDTVGYRDEKIFDTSPYDRDTDHDGYEDGLEIEAGYSPILADGKRVKVDMSLANRLKGKILIQVEGAGQAWYVDPASGRRYYLPPGAQAQRILTQLGTGASEATLAQIPIDSQSKTLLDGIEVERCSKDSEGRLHTQQYAGISCYANAISQNQPVASLLELRDPNYVDALIPDLNQELYVSILAQYIPTPLENYAIFELTKVDFGPIQGVQVVDALAGANVLPEGMSTEEKTRLAQDIETTYVHVLDDIPSLLPRVVCKVHDTEAFVADIENTKRLFNAILTPPLAQVNEPDAYAYANEYEKFLYQLELYGVQSFSFEGNDPAITCILQ